MAIDLVNTVAAVGPDGALVDLIATPDGLRVWLDAQAERLGTDRASADALLHDLPRVQALREALRLLLRAAMCHEPPYAEALALVNATSAAAPSYVALDWPPDRPPRALTQYEAHTSSTALHLATIARSGIEILASEQRHLVRRCEGGSCVLLFLATNPRRHLVLACDLRQPRPSARHYQRRHRPDTPSA